MTSKERKVNRKWDFPLIVTTLFQFLWFIDDDEYKLIYLMSWISINAIEEL